MQLVWQSLNDAWSALRRNWVIVWFPFLIGLGVIIALTIVFVVVMLGSGAAQNWQSLQAGDWAMFGRLLKGVGVFVLIGFVSVTALVTGQAYMQAQASGGDQVQTQDFSAGVRRFYWRFLGGSWLLALVTLVFVTIFFGGMFTSIADFFLQQGAGADVESVLTWLLSTMPMALVGFLLLAVASLFTSMWTKLATVDDIGTIPAILGSIRLVAGRFGQFLALAIINWAATLLLQRIGQGHALLSILMTVANLIWTAYYQLTLFVFYRHLRGVARAPAEPVIPVQL